MRFTATATASKFHPRPLGTGTVNTFRMGFADGRDYPRDLRPRDTLDRAAFVAGHVIGRRISR
jgi:hypothetical protein